MQLLSTNTPSGIHSFLHGDSQELLDFNLQNQPSDWYWRDQSITYDLNSQGYRCPNWEQCDWNNSILLFGGSDIFGLGVKQEQTVSHYITQHSNINTINLAVCATSPMFIWANSTRLSSYNITPKAVIYLWTEPTRFLTFTDDTGINNVKDGSHSETRLGQEWAAHQYQSYQFLRYCMLNVDLIWDCPVLQYPPLFIELDWLDNTKSKQLNILDYGRDVYKVQGHYGPLTYSQWANVFLNDLKL